eukprot:TRINITY_DN172_c1_g1_i1.p1 TRINITY_DN172_c1_g1~~TRINITY_DN172_c1_g1_i1.p1  ORF type:complete len:208 (-),score=-2.51 TRINITY_DN172_c1_g1_i1:102-725(-)
MWKNLLRLFNILKSSRRGFQGGQGEHTSPPFIRKIQNLKYQEIQPKFFVVIQAQYQYMLGKITYVYIERNFGKFYRHNISMQLSLQRFFRFISIYTGFFKNWNGNENVTQVNCTSVKNMVILYCFKRSLLSSTFDFNYQMILNTVKEETGISMNLVIMFLILSISKHLLEKYKIVNKSLKISAIFFGNTTPTTLNSFPAVPEWSKLF